jgi:rRNA pseudouridine-1189 N-methylase Emg1 (Nep1/Mra1 family)
MWSMDPQCDWTKNKRERQDRNGYTESKTKDEKTIASVSESKQGFNAYHLEEKRLPISRLHTCLLTWSLCKANNAIGFNILYVQRNDDQVRSGCRCR